MNVYLGPIALKLLEYNSLVFETFLLREQTKTQKYKQGIYIPHVPVHTSVEDETDQETRQENYTQGSKQGESITNLNIRVLIPLLSHMDFPQSVRIY